MKVIAEVNEKEYGLLCKPSDVEPLMQALGELYQIIWIEAHYDPANEHTETFALKLLSLIDKANEILRFKS